MRNLRNFSDRSQPFTVVVCFDAATHTPSFALTNYGVSIADKLTVTVLGVEVPLYMQIDNVVVTEGRPQGTGGLIRNSAKFDVTFVGPFAISPFTKTLYSAGTNVDSVYFGIWVTDYAKSMLDMNDGAFFGYYKLDANVTWAESSLVTSINLIGILQLQAGRYNEVMTDAETLLDGSEYSQLLEVPAYLGYRGKIKCVGRTNSVLASYTNVAKTAVKGVISGLVQSDVLSGTSIVLGRSPTLGTIVGQVVKLKMGNGCIITGTITDLTGGEYGIDTTGLVLNDKWASITIHQIGYDPVAAPTDLTSATNPNQISLIEEVDRIPSPTMYLRTPGPIEFYPDPTVTPAKVFAKLNGLAEEATKRFNLEDFTWIDGLLVTHPRTLVNCEYHATVQNTVFGGTDAHLDYATWTVPQVYDLMFTNKVSLITDIQKTGMTWELIVTPYVNTMVTLSNNYYVKLLDGTTISTDAEAKTALFYDNGTELVVIPPTDITSITYNCNDFDIPNLCRITLVKRPSDVKEEYADGVLYADVGPTKYAGEVLTWIFTQAGIANIAGQHLTAADNKYGNIVSLVIGNETWGELIDSVLFEAGCTIRFDLGKAILYATGYDVELKTWTRGASTETYFRAEPKAVIEYEDIIDNTVSFEIGRTYTSTDSAGREYVRVYYDFTYQFSEYNGTQLKKLRSNKVAKNNDRVINYAFKHVCDKDTAKVAITQMTRIGHAANVPETTRIYSFSTGFDYTNLCALDPVRLKDFKHVSGEDDPLVAYSDATTNPVYSYGQDGLVCCKYTQSIPYMLTPGLCVVEEITYNFGSDGSPVTVKLKQVQFGTDTNIREVAERLHIPTDAENTTAGDVDYNTADLLEFAEVTCALGTFYIDVQPGGPNVSTVVADDPCCDTTTTGSEISDPIVTIYCGSWPDFCSPTSVSFYAVPRTDSTIGSTDALVFDIYVSVSNALGDEPTSYGLCGLEYPGDAATPGCVTYTGSGGAVDGTMAGTYAIGVLTVAPCVFNAPEGMYSKTIQLKFCISNCFTSTFTIPFTRSVDITVNLRPVSDISIS